MANINNTIAIWVLGISLCAVTAHPEVSANERVSGNGATMAILDSPISNNGDNENRLLEEKKQSAVMEAASAVKVCEIAYKALTGGDLTLAREYVELAKQKLNGLKSTMPDVSMIPIDAQGKLSHLNTDVSRFKALQTKVKELVANNNYQAARPLIDMMADEMRVGMVLLPIVAFTGDVQNISELIGTGNISRAKAHLRDAIDELVVKEEMIPIPILRAEELVAEASNLNLSTGTSQTPSAETRSIIADAREQLKIAEMNATTQLLSKEKNRGLFVSESRHFLE